MTQEKSILNRIKRFKWQYILLGLVIVLLLIYGVMENEIHMRQPSEDWSIGVTIEEEIAQDYRMFSIIQNKETLGFAYAYASDEGIFLREINKLGELQRELSFDLPSIRVMVLKLDDYGGSYHVYYSDRKQLYKRTVDKVSLNLSDEILVSNYSEQFDVKDGIVVTSDDQLLQVIKEDEIIKEISGFDDVKKLLIKSYEGKHYFTYNTVIGGFLGLINGEEITTKMIQNPKEQNDFGYFADIHVDEENLVLISNKIYLASTNPNLMRIYYADKNELTPHKEFNFYHSRTTLDPKIVSVEEDTIKYILGVQQTLDLYDDLEKKFSWIQRGKYTNVSLYTREGDKLIDNTRLTITRRYPMGYDYFNGIEDGVFVWSDSSGDYGELNIAGVGNEWIQHGRTNHDVRIFELGQTIVVGTVSAAIWGTVFHLFRIIPYWYIFLAYLILSLIMYKLVKGDENKKWKWTFFGFVIIALVLKVYLTAIDNYDLVIYENVYPMIFGSNTYLLLASVLSTVFAYIIYLIWERDYSHSSKLLKLSLFIGVDYVLYLLSVIIYMTTAMLVNSSLL